MGKVKIFDFFDKTNEPSENICASVVTTNGFTLGHNKNSQIDFIYAKHQAKHDFLKHVERRVRFGIL